MAIVEALPQSEVIRAFKGTLDFYYWRGLYVVRSWPRRPAMPRSPASTATAKTFAEIIKAQGQWAPEFHDAAQEQSKGTGFTWRDALVSSLYGNLVIEPPPAPQEEAMLAWNLSSPVFGGTNFAVNSTTGRYSWELSFYAALLSNGYTQIRLWMDAWSSQGGQTVTAQIESNSNPGVPIGGSSPWLTIPSVADRFDTGWITINPSALLDEIYVLVLRGSNSSVDLNYARMQVELR